MNRSRINKYSVAAIVIFLSIGIFLGLKSKGPDMESFFGVLEFLHWDHPWNNYKYAREEELKKAASLMKEAGVGFVRFDFLWQDIEPRQNEFDFEKYDRIVRLLKENKINILGILDYNCAWQAPASKWNDPPSHSALFVSYASKVIERYKDTVKYWEVWNEPDSHIYWSKQDGLKSYCSLLKEVYVAAKKIDPECKILNGGLAGGLASVNKLYDNGAKDYFDILNIHFFENPLKDDSIKAVIAYPQLAYKVMERNGDGHKKIWITEIGAPGLKEGLETKNWWMGENPGEEKQAEWLEEVFSQLRKDRNVSKVFWAFFRDCDSHWGNGIDYFGIVRKDFSKKSAFFSLKKITSRK
ncbi:MAG: family 1 glycosylhydrolase [Candidatus Omnitrophota bacterium]